MEATKLHNVIHDAIDEEENVDLKVKVTALITLIQQNNASEIDNTIEVIKEDLNESTFNTYSPSNYKILEEINGTTFLGDQALNKIKEILSSNSYNTAKIISELKSFIDERDAFIKTLTTLRDSLNTLGIDPHYNEENYELGLLLPSNNNYDSIKVITKELNKWDKAIKTYRELVGDSTEDTRITLVNNGSLEFFTENIEQVALCVTFTIERLVKLYKNVLDIRTAWSNLKATGLPKAQEKGIAKHEKDTYNKEIDSIVSDVIKNFADKNIEGGRLNELKISVKGHTNYIAKCIDNGLVIEITPPELSEPKILSEEETEENKKERDKAKTEFEARLKKVNNIKDSLKAGKEILGLGKEVFKMLTTGEEEDEEVDNEEEE